MTGGVFVAVIVVSAAAGLALWWPDDRVGVPALPARQFEPPTPPEGADAVAWDQKGASCGKFPRAIPVTVVGGSSDIATTSRFTAALSRALDDTPPLYVAGRVSCGLVVYIPDDVTGERYSGTFDPEDPRFLRTMISYRVNVYQQGGPFLGTFVGSCWFDEVAKCGQRAATDALVAARKYH
jgi:hypothetical protein